MATRRFFDDADFQDHLVALLCTDLLLLRKTGALLEPDDFRPTPGVKNGRSRWIVAELALEHYQKYQQPIGRLLKAGILEYCERVNMGERVVQEIQTYVSHLHKLPLVGPEAISDKVAIYKREKLKASIIEQMTELQASGQLTDEKWYELSRKAVASFSGEAKPDDYLAGLDKRIELRKLENQSKFVPLFFIDPLDSLIKSLEPGHFGLIMAPPGSGKSTALLWITLAYLLQRVNTLFITLENPKKDVESRLDSIVTGIPIKKLVDRPKTTKRQFERYRRFINAGLRVVDGTQGGMTVDKMEQIILREREAGFPVEAVIIDYDDEIVPAAKGKERRFELAEIYRQLRQMFGRHSLYGWTAAQTKRDTEHLKIIGKDKVAEDISKINKVNLALGLGKGEWGDDSRYIWVAKHNFDRSSVGCHIVSDMGRMMLYDREKTREREMEMNIDHGNEV